MSAWSPVCGPRRTSRCALVRHGSPHFPTGLLSHTFFVALPLPHRSHHAGSCVERRGTYDIGGAKTIYATGEKCRSRAHASDELNWQCSRSLMSNHMDSEDVPNLGSFSSERLC